MAALDTGNLNPFVPNDAVGEALLNGAKLEGPVRDAKSTTTQVDGKLSRDLFKMAGGRAAVAIGAVFGREDIEDRATNADCGAGLHIGGGGTVRTTSASRNVAALFGEIVLPVTKELEVSGAVRYDHYNDVGSKASPQVRVRYSPGREVLLRASAGKGFRAPSLWDLHSPPAFGNSANALDDPGCPAALIADEDARYLGTTLNVRNISATNLQPATSRQCRTGVLLEPVQGAALGRAYWRIEKKDAIGSITADPILANPDDHTLYNQYAARCHLTP